jgi:hypothetical protein
LWVDTNISEEHAASIFRVEVCRFTNRVGYVGGYIEGGFGTQGEGLKKGI